MPIPATYNITEIKKQVKEVLSYRKRNEIFDFIHKEFDDVIDKNESYPLENHAISSLLSNLSSLSKSVKDRNSDTIIYPLKCLTRYYTDPSFIVKIRATVDWKNENLMSLEMLVEYHKNVDIKDLKISKYPYRSASILLQL